MKPGKSHAGSWLRRASTSLAKKVVILVGELRAQELGSSAGV